LLYIEKKSKPSQCGGVGGGGVVVWWAMWCWNCSCIKLPFAVVALHYIEK